MKNAASLIKQPLPVKLNHLSDSEFLEWAEMNPQIMVEHREDEIWTRYVKCWHTLRIPGEQVKRVEPFLRLWATPIAAEGRANSMWTHRLSQIQRQVLEPLSMALATPKDPWPPLWQDRQETITQEAIDKRLAARLRDVILSKKASKLHALAEVLQVIKCPLYIGIHVSEITENLDRTKLPKIKGTTRMFLEFLAFLDSHRRLPSKAEIAEKAEINDFKNASAHRKTLGLTGLPKSKPSW